MTVHISTRDVGPTAQFRLRRLIVNYVVFIDIVARRWRSCRMYWSTVPMRPLAFLESHLTAHRSIFGCH